VTRKSDSTAAERGWDDYIGIVLCAAALALFIAQVFFDRYDLRIIQNPPNHNTHNPTGLAGAYLAYGLFFVLGAAAFLLPVFLLLFGLSHLPAVTRFFGLLWLDDATSHLRERWRSQTIWSALLVFAFAGLFNLLGMARWFEGLRIRIAAPHLGGWFGHSLFEYGFWMIGVPGSAIVFLTLLIIGALTLSNFRLGHWIVTLWEARRAISPLAPLPSREEIQLERRARDLEKQKKKLEEQLPKPVAATPAAAPVPSGLGADLKPVK
jgi:hypothetical protein